MTIEEVAKNREKILTKLKRNGGGLPYDKIVLRGIAQDDVDFALWSLARSSDIVVRKSGDGLAEWIDIQPPNIRKA